MNRIVNLFAALLLLSVLFWALESRVHPVNDWLSMFCSAPITCGGPPARALWTQHGQRSTDLLASNDLPVRLKRYEIL
jgi:hypothetical protein